MSSKGFSLSLKKPKSRLSTGTIDSDKPTATLFQAPQANLFCVYRPTVDLQHQKSIVPFVPKNTLSDVLSKECTKRGTSTSAYTAWDKNGKVVLLDSTLDSVPDNYVVLQWNGNRMPLLNSKFCLAFVQVALSSLVDSSWRICHFISKLIVELV